jgi:uncharacterized protein
VLNVPLPRVGEKTNWNLVFTYYVLACAWSWPFFWWRDIHHESVMAWHIPGIFKTWSYMCGPAISALICFAIFKKHRRITTLRGTSIIRGILFYSFMPVILALLNLQGKYLFYGLLGFVSILGEELGWRGLLQDALKFKSDWRRALVIGPMWEIWHFTNRTAGHTPLNALFRVFCFAVVLTLMSYIFLKLTRRTGSLLVAVALHAAVDGIDEFNMGWQSFLICLPLWAYLLWKWPKTESVSTVSSSLSDAVE